MILPEPIVVEGKSGTIVYLDDQDNIVTLQDAKIAIVAFEDGGSEFFVIGERDERGS